MRATKINSVVRLFTLLTLTVAGIVSGAHAMELSNAAGPKAGKKTESIHYTFERKTFDVSRQHGHVYFNNYWYSHPLIDQHQYVRLIEVFDHQNFPSDHEFFNWAKTLRGTRTYTYDTVKEHRPKSVTNLGPIVLLAAKQRAEIDPAWRFWREQEETRLSELAQKQREAEAIKARQDAELETSRQLVKSATQSAQALSVYRETQAFGKSNCNHEVLERSGCHQVPHNSVFQIEPPTEPSTFPLEDPSTSGPTVAIVSRLVEVPARCAGQAKGWIIEIGI